MGHGDFSSHILCIPDSQGISVYGGGLPMPSSKERRAALYKPSHGMESTLQNDTDQVFLIKVRAGEHS